MAINATTAKVLESSAKSLEPTPSPLGAEGKSSGSYTTTEPSKRVPLPTTPSTTPGSELKAYRVGYDAGLKHGIANYMNTPLMEDMALELTLLRAMVAAMTIEAERHEKLIEHYRIILGVK